MSAALKRPMLAGLLLALVFLQAHAQSAPSATTTVMVVVDGADDELAAAGTSRARLVETLSRRLAAGGMEVLADGDRGRHDVAVLRLRLRLIRSGYVDLYGLNLTLHSPVMVAGGNGWTTIPTWSDGWTGSLQNPELGTMDNFATELADRFLAARASR